MIDEKTNSEISYKEEVLDLGKCIASVTKDGGVHIKCEQNVDKIEFDEKGLSMIKGISELALKIPKKD